MDAKYSPSLYCACDGVTTLTYDPYEILSPYLYAGACSQDGGADTAPDGLTGSATDGAVDSVLPGCNVVTYGEPGCGTAAVPICGIPTIDAKYSPSLYCACDGVTTLTYDPYEILSPYLYAGACNQDGGADSAPEGAVDSVLPGCNVVTYGEPGCGTAAVPICGIPAIDAKYSSSLYCACDGVTTLTYDRYQVLSPYLYAGACNQDGGADVVPPGPDGGATEVRTTTDLGGDNTANPCAACTANQVCVQSFDGTCRTSEVACKTVSDACRTKLLASGVTTCSTLSECESEFCASPYRCIYSSPCGTEAPQAALYCYGP
jgi:hypothetical protein